MNPPLSLVVGFAVGFFFFFGLLITHIRQVYRRTDETLYRSPTCDPEICGQQCYNNNYMNAWCENFTCYCDNDCRRHQLLYPWDDTAYTCARLCNHKHGPCTGSGCANDTYWANSTRPQFEVYRNTTNWLLEVLNGSWVTEYYFFDSPLCFCYDNGTRRATLGHTTLSPAHDVLTASGESENGEESDGKNSPDSTPNDIEDEAPDDSVSEDVTSESLSSSSESESEGDTLSPDCFNNGRRPNYRRVGKNRKVNTYRKKVRNRGKQSNRKMTRLFKKYNKKTYKKSKRRSKTRFKKYYKKKIYR